MATDSDAKQTCPHPLILESALERLWRNEGYLSDFDRRHKCPFDSFAALSCSGQALLHPPIAGSPYRGRFAIT